MAELETFTPAEREYFNSHGEKAIPVDGGSNDADVMSDGIEDDVSPDLDASDDDADDNALEADTDDKAEQPDQDQPKKKDNGRVPLRKLRAEEDRRKEVERQYEELREKFTRGDERLRMIMEAQQAQQVRQQAPEQELSPPDPHTDPIRAIEWQQQQIEAQRQWQEQQLNAQREAAVIAQLDNGYRQAWGQFANNKPDAMNAYKHFVDVTSAYLEMQGIPQAKIDEMVANEERKIAYQAFQRGVNPAEIIYEKAQIMGYRNVPAQAEQPADNSIVKKAEEDVARRQKAASASKSMSSAGGSRGGNLPSIEELANMSEDEFAEFRAKVGERQFRKLMGE